MAEAPDGQVDEEGGHDGGDDDRNRPLWGKGLILGHKQGKVGHALWFDKGNPGQ